MSDAQPDLSLPSAPVAALPMYDLPEIQSAHDAFWDALAVELRAAGVAAPAGLTRGTDLEPVWRNPRLLLGQTCGYPLMTRLCGVVQVVATPVYRAQGCEGSRHRAAIVVRADSPARRLSDLQGARCAVNALDSNSGMNLLRAELAEAGAHGPFFSAVALTGSHRESLRQVANGAADVAAIDGVTLAYLRKIYSAIDGVRVLQWTRASPGLPLVTNAATSPSTVRALQQALLAVAADVRHRPVLQALLIDGFELLTEEDYAPVLAFERQAAARGYPILA